MTLVRERRHQQALRLTLPRSVGLFMNPSPASSSSSLWLSSSSSSSSLWLSSSSSSSSLASSSSSSSPANIDTLSNLKKLSVLGSGNGGTVYKVSHNQTGAIYALKVVRFSEKDVGLIPAIREAEILQRVDLSEYIVKCAGVFHDCGGLGLLMEYMDYGSLYDILCKKKRLSESAISWIIKSVLKGLKYLHGLGIVHQDIKPSNLLVNARGEIKIADFGASRVVAKASADRYSHECTCAYNDRCSGLCVYVNMRGDRVKIADSGASQVVINTSGDQYACTCTCTHNSECNEVCTYLNTIGDQVKIADFGVSRVVVNTGDDQHTHACNGICTHVNKGEQVKIAYFDVNHEVVNMDDGEFAYPHTCTHNNTCNKICTYMNTKEDEKIADFGVSEMVMNVGADQYAYTRSSSHDNACKGTRAYMSPERMDPEQWDGEQCDGYAGDIWSLGVVAMECYMGRFPLVGEDEELDWVTLMCAVCLGENVESGMLKMASPECESFCRRCLERDWRKRGTLEELLLHPFINKFEDCGREDLLNSSD